MKVKLKQLRMHPWSFALVLLPSYTLYTFVLVGSIVTLGVPCWHWISPCEQRILLDWWKANVCSVRFLSIPFMLRLDTIRETLMRFQPIAWSRQDLAWYTFKTCGKHWESLSITCVLSLQTVCLFSWWKAIVCLVRFGSFIDASVTSIETALLIVLIHTNLYTWCTYELGDWFGTWDRKD